MCDKETVQKIDSGKYVAVPKWEHYIKLWSPAIFFFSAIVYVTIWVKDVTALSFDNSSQKEGVKTMYSAYKEHGFPKSVFNEGERSKVLDHVNNVNKDHMPVTEKDDRYVLRKEFENFVTNQNRILNKLDDIEKYLVNK